MDKLKYLWGFYKWHLEYDRSYSWFRGIRCVIKRYKALKTEFNAFKELKTKTCFDCTRRNYKPSSIQELEKQLKPAFELVNEKLQHSIRPMYYSPEKMISLERTDLLERYAKYEMIPYIRCNKVDHYVKDFGNVVMSFHYINEKAIRVWVTFKQNYYFLRCK